MSGRELHLLAFGNPNRAEGWRRPGAKTAPIDDVSRIHVANHHGTYFDVKGPLGASRSVQGQPVIFQAGSSDTGRAFAAKYAEVIFTGQRDFANGTRFYQLIHTALAGYRALAAQSSTVRDFLHKSIAGFGFRVVGSAERMADEIQRWLEERAADGFILRASDGEGQLESFIGHVVPILQQRGLFRREYTGATLRDHLGLARPASRYAALGSRV